MANDFVQAVVNKFLKNRAELPQREALIQKFRENGRNVKAASPWVQHLVIADAILSAPSGPVVECGCYLGGSAVNLSLACAMANRTLYLCDTFKGLPKPDADDVLHRVPYQGWKKKYREGDYAGSLETVKNNLKRYGAIDCCRFIEGDFADTLEKALPSGIAVVFMDADLNKSRDSCIKAVWPKLTKGAWFFSHEAQDLAYISRFFDHVWWQRELGVAAPGFIGAGTGLPLSSKGCQLGYIRKD